MSEKPWFKFFGGDWRSDSALRMCSPSSRLLWLEIICLMAEAEPCGHLLIKGRTPTDHQLAVQVALATDEVIDGLAELEENGVFSRTSAGVIYSRKMVRDARKSKEQRDRANIRWEAEKAQQSEIGNATARAAGNAGSMPQIPEPELEPEEESSGANAPSAREERNSIDDGLIELFPVQTITKPPKKPKSAACRLPEDWQPTSDDCGFAIGEGLDPQEIRRVTDEFHDYWRARVKDATKLDWSATWKNQVRRVVNRRRELEAMAAIRGRSGQGRPNDSDWASIAARRRGYT